MAQTMLLPTSLPMSFPPLFSSPLLSLPICPAPLRSAPHGFPPFLLTHSPNYASPPLPSLPLSQHQSAASFPFPGEEGDQEDPPTRFTTVRMQLAIHTDLPATLIEAIVAKVEMEVYEAGEVVLQMRQTAAGLFFISEGSLQARVGETRGGEGE